MNRLIIANAVKQSMTSEDMDRHGLRPRDDANNTVIVKVAVIANAVKQSMTSDCMDCRASLAVTGTGSRSVCGIGPDTGGSQ